VSCPAEPQRRALLGLLLATLATGCGGGAGGSAGTAPVAEVSGGGNAAGPLLENPAATRIQVLALFSPGVETLYADPDLRIQHLFAVSNQILDDSGVALRVEPVHVERIDYGDGYDIESALDHLTFADVPALAAVPALRDEHAADLVVLFRPYANDGRCGYAWVGGYQTGGDFSHPAEDDFGYAVVAADCSDYVLLHELGHNLGLAHSRRENPEGGSLPWGTGHGMPNDFVTVMASPGEFNAVRLPRLSSPDLDCRGSPCGVARSDPEAGADAVRALARAQDQVAAYR